MNVTRRSLFGAAFGSMAMAAPNDWLGLCQTFSAGPRACRPDQVVPKTAATLGGGWQRPVATPGALRTLDAAYGALRLATQAPAASLDGQAGVHSWYCHGVSGGYTLDLHASWAMFFLWHRWMIFFHERALRSVSSGSAVLVTSPAFMDRTHPYPAEYASGNLFPSTLIKPDVVPDPTEVTACLRYSDSQSSTSVEELYSNMNTWHAAAHQLCALPRKSYLAGASTAAVDPLFFLIHAQIDSYFALWLTPARKAQLQATNPERFLFFDTQLGWVEVTSGDAVNISISYQMAYNPAPCSEPELRIDNFVISKSPANKYQIAVNGRFVGNYAQFGGEHHHARPEVDIKLNFKVAVPRSLIGGDKAVEVELRSVGAKRNAIVKRLHVPIL